jgi:hypothetical protein
MCEIKNIIGFFAVYKKSYIFAVCKVCLKRQTDHETRNKL